MVVSEDSFLFMARRLHPRNAVLRSLHFIFAKCKIESIVNTNAAPCIARRSPHLATAGLQALPLEDEWAARMYVVCFGGRSGLSLEAVRLVEQL